MALVSAAVRCGCNPILRFRAECCGKFGTGMAPDNNLFIVFSFSSSGVF